MTTTKNDPERRKILETIMKIAALTETGSGAFEGEIAAASAKIQQLMDKHAVTWAEIQAAKADVQNEELRQSFVGMSASGIHKSVLHWHWRLAGLIARMTNTKNFTIGPRMVFWGSEENARVAADLYILWAPAIRREADKALKRFRSELVSKYYHGQRNFYTSLPPHLQTKNYRDSWITGCLDAMSEKIAQQEAARTAQVTTALMVVTSAMERQFAEMSRKWQKHESKGRDGFSMAGYMRGLEFGRDVSIGAKPLTTTKKDGE